MTQLSRMAHEGATAEQIAAALDRTVEAVRIKAAHQRIPLPLSGRQRPRDVGRATASDPRVED